MKIFIAMVNVSHENKLNGRKCVHRVALIFAILIFAISLVAPASAQQGLYGQRIVVSADSGADLKAAANDAAQVLQKMTGREFTIGSEYSGSGICLARSDTPQASADLIAKLKDKGREPFVIRSDGKEQLWIVANGDSGLQHGLYFFLEQLGVRYYFPNDNWVIIPQRNDITLKVDRVLVPDYKLRNFFGTGGVWTCVAE